MKVLCHFMMCKWIHITDVVVGFNNSNQPIIEGLWQCRRCRELSKGVMLERSLEGKMPKPLGGQG